MENTFILKKIRSIHRGNTGSRGHKGDRACAFVLGDFENKNAKTQTRIIAKRYGEFGKFLSSSDAIKDYLYMEGKTYSWDEIEKNFRIRIRDDGDLWMF